MLTYTCTSLVQTMLSTNIFLRNCFALNNISTHWGRDKMTDISRTAFQIIFKAFSSWMIKYVIKISQKFVPKGSINNIQHWFWSATSHYLKQLDESTARRQLKSPRSLSGRSLHLTLVTKWSRSHMTLKIQISRSWPRSNPLSNLRPRVQNDMFAFRFVAIGPFLAEI